MNIYAWDEVDQLLMLTQSGAMKLGAQGNGGGTLKSAAQIASEQAAATRDELREPEFQIPKHRTFVVRKWSVSRDAVDMSETTIEAHIVQPNERGMVCFYDLERRADGEPTMRLHRIFYGVEDVEEVLRVPSVSRILAH